MRLALAVTLVVAAALTWRDWNLAKSLGDTDDAMRLVLVRDLLSGRGWYDQWVGRLQPPMGVYMHWSRLLDGGLAAMTAMFRLALPPAAAETATRLVWPLMWIFPAALCSLALARRLGGSAAMFVCAAILAVNLQIYEQFHPGRVDHHDVQIVMALVAAVCAMTRARRAHWALVGGAATGFGLAVGMEALPFEAVVGASYALRLAWDEGEAEAGRNYGAALAASTIGFFLLQTPPMRWGIAACDALGLNLVAAVTVAGAGLALLAAFAGRLSRPARLAGLAGLGLAVAVIYLKFDPLCLGGPFAAVDPRLKPFWFDRITELLSWPQLLRSDRVTAVFTITAGVGVALAVIVRLLLERSRISADVALACVLGLLAVVLASQAYRMQDYVFWLGFPMLAWLFGWIVERWLGGVTLAAVAISLFASPLFLGAGAGKAVELALGPPPASAIRPVISSACYDTAAYRQLAAQPPGLVLGGIDLGSFVLANTPHSVVTAPYHRMSWGIYAAHQAMAASPNEAEARVRALKVDYVVDCPTAPLTSGPSSLEASLRRGLVPSWLDPLPAKGQVLKTYRVRPRIG